MILNDENYYSVEADREYLSVSQYKSYLHCEAATIAQLKGEYERPKNEAFLIGSYVHSFNDGTLEQFKEEHPEMYSSTGKTKGQLKSTFQTANKMIEALKNDSICMKFLEGEKELIITGELFGIKWKGKVDSINLEKGYFTDLKTTKSIHQKTNGLSFIENYDYISQMAIYRELIKQQYGKDLIPYIVAVEKNDNPLKAVIKVDERYTFPKLEEIEYNLERIKALRSGDTEPVGCGECEYCRKNSKVTKILTIDEL